MASNNKTLFAQLKECQEALETSRDLKASWEADCAKTFARSQEFEKELGKARNRIHELGQELTRETLLMDTFIALYTHEGGPF